MTWGRGGDVMAERAAKSLGGTALGQTLAFGA